MNWSDPLTLASALVAAAYALSLPYTAWLVRHSARIRRSGRA